MLARVSTVTRRLRGESLKHTTVTADALRIGRGAGNEVPLPDIRVGVREAALQLHDGQLVVSRVGSNPVRVNGTPIEAAEVKPGDQILIGPYRIDVVEPPAEFEVALTVELVNPLGDDLTRLQTDNIIGLGRTRLSKRRTAWGVSIAILVVFLVLPVVGYFVNPMPDPRKPMEGRVLPTAIDEAWNVGEISNPHKNFWRECRACHETAFVTVRDEACLACHNTVQHHVDMARFPKLRINTIPCGGCHQEHRGPQGVVTRAEVLCTNCHADLKRTASNAELRDAVAFGPPPLHPPFRVSVVADTATKTLTRVDLGGPTPPADHPNLKFSHRGHLKPAAWPREMRQLVCADCHAPQPGGGLMQPINFTRHCAECHRDTLKFDAAAPERMVPHGDATLAQRSIQDFYARLALEGGVTDLSAPAVVRRRPGTPLAEPERLEALAWANQRALAGRDFVFDDRRGCGTCHEVDRASADFKIAPVLLQTHFLPKAEFNHARHMTIGCAGCHAASDSIASSDVLIPNIESCVSCHGGESASAKVRSTCISCHDFHKPGIGPLRPYTKGDVAESSGN